MNKKFTYIFLIAVVFLFNLTVSVNGKSQQARIGYQQFRVNGSASNVVTYNIDGENYYRIRDIAFALKDTNKKFDTVYNASKNEIVLLKGKNYTSENAFVIFDNDIIAKSFSGNISIDSKPYMLDAYNIKGYNYYKIDDIGKLLDFGIRYETVGKTISISTNESYLGL